METNRSFRLLILSLALALSACAKDNAPIVVSDVKEVRSTEGNGLKPAGSLEVTATFQKAAILNRTFNYSSSLQFSSIVDGDISTAMMGLSLGEVPANFMIVGNKLKLVTDASINFESDVNHPARLIYEFPIVSQNADSVTITVDKPSPISDTFLFGNKNKTAIRYSFLRSFEHVQADELTMIESTVELVDGSMGQFIESFRPREKTVAADFKPIYNDSELSNLADRYDFLDAGEVYVPNPKKPAERIKTKMANRWDLRNGKPVEWYITSNVPDAYIGDVKNAVEAWNRYSKAAGKPDLIKFMGKLPEGVKVGDPRYNLIIWDTVQDAGAAYESQNADPVTGVQSHSMIYIPLAWVNIGKDYWNKMSPDVQAPGEAISRVKTLQGALQSDIRPDVGERGAARAARLSKLLKERSFLGRKLPVHCMDAADMHLAMESKQKPEEFARGLLKGVVFHEMGHAFGLGHNFKGSLSYDSDDASKPFSNSIMDYNHYNEEEGAFASLDSADGALLEYDRQIISVLYNDGKDVKDSDPKLPACADDVADSTDKGVDPLCIRYDIGSDVTKEAFKALKLFTEAGSKRGKMEAISAQKVLDSLIGLPPADSVKTEEDLVKSLIKGQSLVAGTVGIYISASANSFGYLAGAAMKSLKVFQKDVLPEEYNENEMRTRALQLLETGASMEEFPALVKEAMAPMKPKMLEYFASTALVQGLPRDDREKVMGVIEKLVDKLMVKGVQTAILAKMQTRLVKEIASTPTAPLAFLERDGKNVDLELEVMNTLEKLSGAKLGSADRPVAARAAALASLKSYSRSENYQAIANRVVAALDAEIAGSTDALKKEAARSLKAEFTKKDEEKAASVK